MAKHLFSSTEVRCFFQLMTMFVDILEGIFVHFSLQIINKSLKFYGCSLANGSLSSLRRIIIGLMFGNCLGHFMTLMCFFLSNSFVAWAVCCGLMSYWEAHPWPAFSLVVVGRRLALSIVCLHVSLHPFVDDVKLSCALATQTTSKHNVTTFRHDVEEGVLGIIGSISLPQNTLRCVNAKQFDFGVIWLQHLPIIS